MQRFTVFATLMLLLIARVPSHAQDEPIQVAASFSILADVAANVAGDAANVTSVMPRGADPHSFTPAPRDIAALARADVVLVNGMNFEEGLMEAIENADADMNIVTVSQCVEVLAFGGHEHTEGDEHDHEGEEMAAADDEHAEGDEHDHEGEEMAADHHEHAEEGMSAIAALCAEHHEEMHTLHEEDGHHEAGDDHDHKHETLGMMHEACGTEHDHEHEESDHSEAEGDEHAHDHGECDPHVWTEPHNVIFWTMMIRDTLVELDPANAETYEANAASYIETLDALAHDFYKPALESIPADNRKLVTNHEAFGYMAAAGDLEIVGVVLPGGSTIAEPSAGDIAALIEQINAENVTAVFSETTASADVAEQVASETGAQIYVLYSGTLSEDNTAGTYIDFIRYNVTTVVEALGGSVPAA